MPNPKFPQPVRPSPAVTRWRLSDLLKYEAALAGTDPATIPQETFLPAKRVASRYGVGISTIWRWAATAQEGAA